MGFAIWVFGILLAVAAVFCSVYLAGDSLFVATSYKASIPTLYFISLSAFISTAAEGFDLVLHRTSGLDEQDAKKKLGFSYLSILFVTFIVFVVFAKSVIDQKIPTWVVSGWDMVLPFVLVILALIANGTFKSQFRRLSHINSKPTVEKESIDGN